MRLNEEIVAPVNTRQTLLIDITRSHCYRVEWAGYGFDDSGHGKIIYQPRPFQFLDSNPDFFMESLPGSVVTAGTGAVRDTLKDIACPKRVLKAGASAEITKVGAACWKLESLRKSRSRSDPGSLGRKATVISVITALLWAEGKRDATGRLESFGMDSLSGMLSIFCHADHK